MRGRDGRWGGGGGERTRGAVLFAIFGDLFSRLVLLLCCMLSVLCEFLIFWVHEKIISPLTMSLDIQYLGKLLEICSK